jgi:hypothetical protein
MHATDDTSNRAPVLAIACDAPTTTPVPTLPLNRPEEVARFINRRFGFSEPADASSPGR